MKRPTLRRFSRPAPFWAIFIVSCAIVALPQFFAFAQENGSAEKRADLERQIQELEKEAEGLDVIIKGIQGEKRTLANEVSVLNAEAKKRELEIKRLDLALKKAKLEIAKKETGIAGLETKIAKSRKSLSASLFALYTYDHESIISVFFKKIALSDFFATLAGIHQVQAKIQEGLEVFHADVKELEREQAELEDFRQEQSDIRSLQEVERRFLTDKKKEKDKLLKETQGKETVFQQVLSSKKRDIATLRTQLFYLERTGITAEDAIKFAELAAKRTGIRTAFLLALLEVETGRQFEDGVISVGTNIGTGSWKRDMYDCYISLKKPKTAEAQKEAFFSIAAELGLDPEKMPVSRRPSYGCGGAMGPAQFIPTTWLLFKDRVARLTGHNPPSPWNVEDAFTASALYLADSGATSKTETGEIRAAKAYISGSPNCSTSICRWYANTIISLSRSIDRVL